MVPAECRTLKGLTWTLAVIFEKDIGGTDSPVESDREEIEGTANAVMGWAASIG